MVSSAPTSPGANSESVAAVIVALAAAVGGVLGWGGARLCDSLVRTTEEEEARVATEERAVLGGGVAKLDEGQLKKKRGSRQCLPRTPLAPLFTVLLFHP